MIRGREGGGSCLSPQKKNADIHTTNYEYFIIVPRVLDAKSIKYEIKFFPTSRFLMFVTFHKIISIVAHIREPKLAPQKDFSAGKSRSII